MFTKYRILGINDEVTTCECCGRTGLKCTVVLTDGEQEVRFGRDCAARATTSQWGVPKSANKIERIARDIQYGNVRNIPKPFYNPAGKR